MKILSAIFLLGFATFCHSTPLDNLVEQTRPVGASPLNTIVFGNNTFVAAGNDGTIITSTNGINWTLQNSHTTAKLTRLRFLNGNFIALATTNVIYSSNGSDWKATPISANGLYDIAFANGIYYVTGVGPEQGDYWTSASLESWTSHSNPWELGRSAGLEGARLI